MRRMHLVEIHDHPRFPAFLRDLVTDALQAMWDYGNVYKAIAPTLRRALEATHTGNVVDLCSGAGGPWLRLSREFEKLDDLSHDVPVNQGCLRAGSLNSGCLNEVCLTDKYPNLGAFERARTSTGRKVVFRAEPIDATQVPCALKGFRTMFSSFHHFTPEDARRVLLDAVGSGQGVGIFEAAKRCPRTMALIFWVPLMALGLTPLIRPFRWSRLFWTYLVPVVPFVLWFDGLVSCLRTYSLQELKDLVNGIPGSRWEIGEARTGLLPITYLIGFPEAAASLN